MVTEARAALDEHRVIVIYRGVQPERCLALTEVLYAAGIRLFEVTLNSVRPYEAIGLLRRELGAEAQVGAGTVLDPDDVPRVADAGASFVISPHLDESIVARTKEAGLVSIPGAFSPTEIVRAVRAGADLVKVFPIRPVGPDYISQIRGPLHDVPIVATGGVDAELARECFARGCHGVGVGAHLLGDSDDPHALAREARRFLDAG